MLNIRTNFGGCATRKHFLPLLNVKLYISSVYKSMMHHCLFVDAIFYKIKILEKKNKIKKFLDLEFLD